MAIRALLLALAIGGCATASAQPPLGYHLVPGSFEPGRGPDGNSVFLDAPEGLILVDTGRHPEHQAELIAHAAERGRPIAAIVNTHWHLDHSGGNAEVRAVFPHAPLYASTAVERALTGFFPRSRAAAEDHLKSGQAGAAQTAEIRRDFAAMEDAASLRPTVPITRSGPMTIAGRRLVVNLAPYAATEGDVWLHLPDEGLVIAGDLVVALAPFMDTACPEGWRKALDSIAAAAFDTLIPGHGAPMSKAAFQSWRAAFNALLDCAAGDAAKQACVAGWRRDAAAFIPAGDAKRAEGMVGYYIDTRLRAAAAERNRYCPGGPG